jgi:hypothetical protein
MHSFAPIRFTIVASLALTASLLAQSPNTPQANPAASPQLPSTLPPTPLTTPPTPSPQPLTPSQLPPKRAQVTYADGTLSISADNASLNQILRQISTDTGMKITGGVSDERVFGEYGPAPPDQILSALLDGTGSNMVLVHGDGVAPAELILTPRQGGATPPNPNAAAFNDRSEPQEIPHNQAVQPGQSVPEIPNPNNQVNPVANPAASTQTPAADSSQPQSPNGVKTPQQIYEELQRLRTQQQQQQPKPQ